MQFARITSSGATVSAYFASKRDAPFACVDCGDPVLLRSGRTNVNHFAHENVLRCRNANNESEAHKRCKLEIYNALRQLPNVTDAAVERPLGTFRPDISAVINGVSVGIEVQISNLSLETILARTIEYHRKGICVLWLLQWTPELDRERYSPQLWERWIHAAYFGRVYYWTGGLNIISYRFEPVLKSTPKAEFHTKGGKLQKAGGYTTRLKRFRRPVKEAQLNLARDFNLTLRTWWEGGGIKVPDAKLYMHRAKRWE